MDKACCVTGHRDIPSERVDFVKRELKREVLEAIDDGFTLFISGFAEGTDLLFAQIVIELQEEHPTISLEAALPYRGRLKTPNTGFQKLIAKCRSVIICSESYHSYCFANRNHIMVNKSQRVIAVYDGRIGGGTLSTIKFAQSLERDVRLIRI